MKYLTQYALPIVLLITIFQGGYIHAKAWFSQHLLEFAWTQSITQNAAVKPWPWADTQAVARLSIPKLALNLVVLDGTSGEAMAFGPGLNRYASDNGTAAYVIGGHRDTHMKFLKNLSEGDTVSLTTIDGVEINYEIKNRFVADVRSDKLKIRENENSLVLVTCYPFDALMAGGPLRHITVATPVENANDYLREVSLL